jgi:hypothetical protein
MSDGSPTLFDRVLDTSPENTENKYVMIWHRVKKHYVMEDTLPEFSKGKLNQKAVNDLFDDLKNSDYWEPELPMRTKLMFWLIAFILFAIFIIPSWIILGSSTQNLGALIVGYILTSLAIISPAIVLLFYARSQQKRYEAREQDFKERLIEHNRKNFIPHDYPVKMSLFGAYFSIDRPNAKSDNFVGPLVSVGNKKLNKEEQKYELAYLDVDEEVDYIENPIRQSSTSKPQPSPRNQIAAQQPPKQNAPNNINR